MLKENSQFSHFTIIRQLGSGGMGQVFLARDQKLGREVAIKILQSDIFTDQEKKERFLREAQTAAKVSHGNVMAVYDIDAAPIEPGGEPVSFLVMEYINGQSLSEYLQKKQEMSEIVRLAEKIASGLAEAHQLGIVHRDIKADNILVTAAKEPKILDFGLAKAVDPVQWSGGGDVTATISKELTRAGKIVGTVSYMSPEQARGETVDTRSDIFSFGILLYRMVTGVLPFDGTTQVSTLAKILETQPESPRIKNNAVPPELERIIEKCLRKDPGDRYQNTQDLVVDLRNLRRKYDSGISETISLQTDAINLPKPKSWRTALSLPQMIGIALVVIVGLGAILKWFNGDFGKAGSVQASENRLAILSFDNKTGDQSLDWLQTGLPEILVTDLGQNLSLEVLSNDRLRDYLSKQGSASADFSTTQYREAARSLGVKTIVSGAYYKVDTLIRIDARIEDVTSGTILSAEKVQGGKSNPFGLVDSLTGKVLASLHLRDQSSGQGVQNVLSSSPEAYKEYLEGMRLFEQARYDEAIRQFSKAASLDTTFALAYMRIAMAQVFSGKLQLGAAFMAKAKKFEQKLPPRDRNKLDVYADFWLTKNFDAAFTKQQSFVNTYPDDKEGLAIYGVLLWELRKDTVGFKTYIDSALSLDPNFQMALDFCVASYSQRGQYDKAIAAAKKLVDLAPESPNAYIRLANLYDQKGDANEALAVCRQSLAKFPDDLNIITAIAGLFSTKREFDSARVYLELFKQKSNDDPYRLVNYYASLGNLATWEGKFKESIRLRKLANAQAIKTNDSTFIGNGYRTLSVNYERIDQKDSAAAYLFKSINTMPNMGKLGLPTSLADLDPKKYGDTSRVMFKQVSTMARAKLPSELWPLLDLLDESLEAIITSDTAKRIAAIQKISTMQQDPPASGNHYDLGMFYVVTGKYQEGLDNLLPFVEGGSPSSNAYYYLSSCYYVGRAYEGLGKTQEALAKYDEVLKYWGHPDYEIQEILETRAHVAKLRG